MPSRCRSSVLPCLPFCIVPIVSSRHCCCTAVTFLCSPSRLARNLMFRSIVSRSFRGHSLLFAYEVLSVAVNLGCRKLKSGLGARKAVYAIVNSCTASRIGDWQACAAGGNSVESGNHTIGTRCDENEVRGRAQQGIPMSRTADAHPVRRLDSLPMLLQAVHLHLTSTRHSLSSENDELSGELVNLAAKHVNLASRRRRQRASQRNGSRAAP